MHSNTMCQQLTLFVVSLVFVYVFLDLISKQEPIEDNKPLDGDEYSKRDPTTQRTMNITLK